MYFNINFKLLYNFIFKNIFLFTIIFFTTLSCTKTENIELIPYKETILFDENKFDIQDRNKYLNTDLEKKINISYNTTLLTHKFYTKEQIIEDLDFFIYLLQTDYANYDKFGGDSEFFKRKNELLETIKNKKSITDNTFLRLLLKHFDNIYDFHFYINDNSIKPITYNYWIYDKFLDKKIVDNISEEDKEKYLRLTLDDNGNLRYTLVDVKDTFLLENNIKLHLKNNKVVTFKLSKILYKSQERYTDFFEKEKYFYIKMPTFRQDLYKDYENIVKGKDLILDLRSNSGGNPRLANSVLKNYFTNTENLVFLGMHGYLIKEKNNIKWIIQENDLSKFKKIGNYNIYILVDNQTASASEYLIRGLKIFNPENTIIIGTNTSGILSSNTPRYQTLLPHTKIGIRYGSNLSYNVKFGLEGIGYKPDIWLNPYDSNFLDKVEKFVNKNNSI